jgi:hypothetical protein
LPLTARETGAPAELETRNPRAADARRLPRRGSPVGLSLVSHLDPAREIGGIADPRRTRVRSFPVRSVRPRRTPWWNPIPIRNLLRQPLAGEARSFKAPEAGPTRSSGRPHGSPGPGRRSCRNPALRRSAITPSPVEDADHTALRLGPPRRPRRSAGSRRRNQQARDRGAPRWLVSRRMSWKEGIVTSRPLALERQRVPTQPGRHAIVARRRSAPKISLECARAPSAPRPSRLKVRARGEKSRSRTSRRGPRGVECEKSPSSNAGRQSRATRACKGPREWPAGDQDPPTTSAPEESGRADQPPPPRGRAPGSRASGPKPGSLVVGPAATRHEERVPGSDAHRPAPAAHREGGRFAHQIRQRKVDRSAVAPFTGELAARGGARRAPVRLGERTRGAPRPPTTRRKTRLAG